MILEGCRAVLLDIDGTITDGVGGPALPGAVAAVKALVGRMPVRYVTNATSWSRESIARSLTDRGFPMEPGMLITPTVLASRVLGARDQAQGVLIAEPSTLPDLAWYTASDPETARSVLIATEGHDLTIRDLQPALEALLNGAHLYTLQQNRVFRRAGRLVTDLGPVAAFLGYAANVTWENVGKPSPLLFQALAADLGLEVSDLAMVGDDAEFDAAGAIRAGCGAGILVRTGKYREGDEAKVVPEPSAVIGSVSNLV